MGNAEYVPGYEGSWALVVGVDHYLGLTPLTTAVRGAQAVAALLRDELKFTVTQLFDQDATRETILRWFSDLKPSPNDRVLFYFAGHGFTQDLKSRAKGFLALADSQGYWNSLGMDDIVEQAEALPAKHVLYLLDACFTGLALRGRSDDFGVDRTLDYLLTRPATYAITAGGEEVTDDDAAGEHSLFTHYLLQAFKDTRLQADGLLRAKEVGLYIEENVSAHRRSHALPNHGYLQGSGDGDFVFRWQRGPRLTPDLEFALRSEIAEVRWGAVAGLIQIIRSHDAALAPIARERLETVSRNDPDGRVRSAAQSLFDEEKLLSDIEADRIRQSEADQQLEEARQKQEDAERVLRETEAQLEQARRKAEEDRLLRESTEAARQEALAKAELARNPTPGAPQPSATIDTPPSAPPVVPHQPPTAAKRRGVVWAIVGIIALAAVGGIALLASGGLLPFGAQATQAPFGAEPTQAATATVEPNAAIPTGNVSANVMVETFGDATYEGSYDHDKWQDVTGDVTHSFVQENGALVVTQTGGSEDGSALESIRYAKATLYGPTSFEADIRLDSGDGGNIQLNVRINDVWSNQCILDNVSFIGAYCWGFDNNYGEIRRMGTDPIRVEPGSWHTMRIEIYPGNLQIINSIDGVVVQDYTPPNIEAYSNTVAWVSIGVWGDNVTGAFDNIRFGPIGE